MDIELPSADIFLYDIHLSLAPLLDPTILRPAFRFLADRDLMARVHKSRKAIEDSRNFTVRPLGRHLSWSHFWRHYAEIDLPSPLFPRGPWPWELQIPLRCVPRNFAVDCQLAGNGIRLSVHPVVFLFPCGWSSNLGITVDGSLDLTLLKNLVFELLQRPVYQMGDEPSQTLAGVFMRLEKLVQDEIYLRRIKTESPVKRWSIVEIASKNPLPMPPYSNDAALAARVGTLFSLADRARLHSIACGKAVEVDDVLRLEKEGGFTKTRLRNDDFALTYFDSGSLISLSNSRVSEKKKRRSNRCMASNARNCSMMISMLLALYDQGKIEAGKSPDVLDTLRSASPTILAKLGASYDNAFCGSFFENHKRLRGLLAETAGQQK